MFRPLITLLTIICSGSLLADAPKPSSNELDPVWLKLSILSQNAGHQIHMLGVDSDEPNTASFKKTIQSIDTQLDLLVTKGVLKKKTFQLKPQLDLEESLIESVGKFMEKAAEKYGYYVVREMMDVGTRQRLKEFDDQAPVILNVRMPEKLLKELETLLKKSGGK